MKLTNVFRSAVLALALGSGATSALAAVAVAAGQGNYIHVITEAPDTRQAEKRALAGCATRDTGCKIVKSSSADGALATARGKHGVTAAIELKPEFARDKAMAACRKHSSDCEFVSMHWEPGTHWHAIAWVADDENKLDGFWIDVDNESKDATEKDVLDRCRAQVKAKDKEWTCKVESGHGPMSYTAVDALAADKHVIARIPVSWYDRAGIEKEAQERCKKKVPTAATCKMLAVFTNPGPLPVAKSFKAVESASLSARLDRAQQERPVHTTQVTSCTNRCTNGSCLRTFPDGRTERWQAPRVFDPLSNDWKWETSSCGG